MSMVFFKEPVVDKQRKALTAPKRVLICKKTKKLDLDLDSGVKLLKSSLLRFEAQLPYVAFTYCSLSSSPPAAAYRKCMARERDKAIEKENIKHFLEV